MPRPERPLFPDSDPLHAFAARLRELRVRAGAPTYGRMARKTGRSSSALADAAGGDQLPRWETVVAYAEACSADPDLLRVEWEKLRDLRALPALGRALFADAPQGLTNLNRRPSPYFFGREESLHQLARALARDAAGTGIGPALYGIGGIGKSELALQYATANLSRYTPVWWITADTDDNVMLALAELTRALEPGWPPTAGTADAATWALRWLRAHADWLIVLDNVHDPAVIQPVLAVADRGRAIVTSRRVLDWTALGLRPVSMSVLDRIHSVDLIVARSGREQERDRAEALAALVGDLPLALNHVVSYLNERRHVSMAEYERRFRAQPRRILSAVDRANPSLESIDRTWRVSIAEIARQDRLAGALLDVMAYLHPDRIPVGLLLNAFRDELAVDDALTVTASFSIVSRTADAVSMHRLLQLAIRLSHDSPAHLQTAVTLLWDAVPPGDPRTSVAAWPRWAELTPHIESVHHALRSAHPDARGELAVLASRLLTQDAVYLRDQGRYDSAIAMLEHAADLAAGELGSDGTLTLSAQYELCGALWGAGRFAEAIELGRVVLRGRERVLGPDHPDTLSAASYFAIGYREVGRLEEALALSLTTLAARTRILGPDHPDTLQSGNNTAGCYKALGRYDEALRLYESTAGDRGRVLGPDHFDTLQSLHNLAGGYLAAGRVETAVSLYRSTLHSRRAILGPHHPDTLHTQHNLARALRLSGDEPAANALMREVLVIRMDLFGADHPNTVRSRSFLDQSS